jgi:hypothetical protein
LSYFRSSVSVCILIWIGRRPFKRKVD